MEHLGSHADTLPLRLRTDGSYHELLEGDGRIRVGTAVYDVHHRHRQHVGIRTTEIAVERNLQVVGSRVGHSQGDTEDGVGAEVLLRGRTVELEHLRIDGPLVEHIHANQGRGDLLVHIPDSEQDTLAQEATLVTVTKLQGLILTCRST